MDHQSKLTKVVTHLGDGYFRMQDNWLKKGDIVFNTRMATLHSVESDDRETIKLSNWFRINTDDLLQHIGSIWNLGYS